MVPTVAMVATHWTPTFENMRRSLHVNGFDYEILGWGEKWSGFQWRVDKYIEFLSSQSPESFVIFVDAYDCFANRKAADFEATFNAFGRPIVVGAEWFCASTKNCGKIDAWWKNNNRKKTFRNKVNAGFIAGYVGPLLEAYSWIRKNNFTDDQLGLSQWIDAYGHATVVLDTSSALVYNCNIMDGFRRNQTAFFLHFPGPLLKLGLFPQYNHSIEHSLGVYGRKIYPSEILDAVLWALFITVALQLLLRQPRRP
jgi:hypothetical protein